MGVYRPKKSKYYWIDFYYKGRRYRESSESPRKRDAELMLARRRYEVRQESSQPAATYQKITLSAFLPQYMKWANDQKKPRRSREMTSSLSTLSHM